MKEEKRADRAVRKEERSGTRDTEEKQKQAAVLAYNRANVVSGSEGRSRLGKKGEEFNKET